MVRLATLGLIAVLWLAPAPLAAAQTEEPPPGPRIDEVDQPAGGIIPQPNSGSAPENPGDRGGALQLTLLGLIVAFAAIAVWSIRRASRKGLAQPRGTPSQPDSTSS